MQVAPAERVVQTIGSCQYQSQAKNEDVKEESEGRQRKDPHGFYALSDNEPR